MENIISYRDFNSCAREYFIENKTEIIHEKIKSFLGDLMSAISEKCIKSGAKDIGHIKAYVEYETGFIHSNTLGEPDDIVVNGRDGKSTKRFRIVINSVILGLKEEDICNAIDKSFVEVSHKFGFDTKDGHNKKIFKEKT